ncbi:MAG: response regulator [Granulosicoccus sp.]
MQPENLTPRLLLVEDNDIDVELVRRIATRYAINIPIVRACNGVEALEILQSPDESGLVYPYIILLDINMPMMGGFELLEHLAIHGPEIDVPIYILTTSDSLLDRNKLAEYKIAGYLVKPLTKSAFSHIIDSYNNAA